MIVPSCFGRLPPDGCMPARDCSLQRPTPSLLASPTTSLLASRFKGGTRIFADAAEAAGSLRVPITPLARQQKQFVFCDVEEGSMRAERSGPFRGIRVSTLNLDASPKAFHCV